MRVLNDKKPCSSAFVCVCVSVHIQKFLLIIININMLLIDLFSPSAYSLRC